MFALTFFGIALAVALMQPILAQYQSVCGHCGHLIVTDEEIVEIDGEWCHADCAPEDDE